MEAPYTKPFYMFFLIMPMGISQGFVTVALPFLLTRNGFPVALTAGIVAIGISANLWRFVWGPIVDLSLSLHKWYWLGLLACVASLLILSFIPFTLKDAPLLSAVVFVSQVTATFTVLPVNGFMAKRIKENRKGRASGWYQAGSLASTGLGGGAGLWLATHYNLKLASIVLGIASLLFAMVILLIKDIPHVKEQTLAQEIKGMGKDMLSMIKLPVALFVMILIVMPIGTGAMANLWSAVAKDWNTDADTVVLVTGLLCGGVSAIGCLAGGVITDRWGVWNAYLGSGVVCALVTILIAVFPYYPATYIVGVLAYGLCTGLMYTAFTAIIFFVIGKKNVATKYSLMSSLGNLPVVYMTTFNGWTHDMFGSRYMLSAEAIAGLIFVIIFFLILKRMRKNNLIPVVVESNNQFVADKN
ncbi:MFS transporter [Pedobacter sp. LMG 31462]|uniref:MFS transporter n=2 Tax=Pedobacter gandavensis TaxID=2679963 RepID=A0ABR6ET84_9SPHI|nr:MFS transporter [Pedobacter gandavensis]